MDQFVERGKYISAFQKRLYEELVGAESDMGLGTKRRIRVTLNDGTVVVVRPIRPDDVLLLLDMHRRLSSTSIHYRYLRSYKPTFEDMHRISHIQDDEGAALVATLEASQETAIGLAYYVVDKQQPGTAEPAIVIEDRFQGQGLGRILMQHLTQSALARDICAFNALIDPTNERIMHIIQGSGLRFERKMDYGGQEVRVLLNPYQGPMIDRSVVQQTCVEPESVAA